MEQNIPKSSSESTKWTGVVLLATLCGVAGAVVPLGLFLLPGLYAYAMFRTRPALLALFAAGFLFPALLLYAPLTAVCLTVLAAGMAAALYWLSKLRFGNAYTVMLAAGIGVACLYAALCMPGVLSGAGAFADAQTMVDAVLEQSRAALAALAATGVSPQVAESVNAYYDAISQAVPSLVVPVLCGSSGMLGLSNLLFFRLLAKKRTVEFGLAPLRPFRLWQIPRSMVFGLFAVVLGATVLEWSGWSYGSGMTSAVNVVVSMPLILQGLCVVDFVLYRSGKNVTGKRVTIYTITGLLFNLLQLPLLTIGCFDQLFHYREKLSAGPPPASPLNR